MTDVDQGAVTHHLPPGARLHTNPESKAALDARRRDEQDKMSRALAADNLLRQLRAAQSGQAGFSEDGVELWAHCGNVNAGCDDTQERVTGTRVTMARTFRDGGDDGPHADAVERSWSEYEFANPEDANCKRCDARRHLSEQQRPTYAHESGFDQRGLLKIARNFAGGRNTSGEVVQAAQPAAAQTPLDALGYRLADGSLSIEEYRERRAVLEGVSEIPDTPLSTDNAPVLPEGVRQRGSGFQAYKRVEGKQVQRTFGTVEEAAEWREATAA